MKDAFSSIYNDFKTILIVGESVGLVIGLAILAILIILLFVGFYSMQTPKLLVRYRFILISYASTIYFFTVLLENLFGFGFFSIIGIVMMMLNARKAYINTIAMTLMVRKDFEPQETEEDVKDEGDGEGQV
jgi:predicted membrane protein